LSHDGQDGDATPRPGKDAVVTDHDVKDRSARRRRQAHEIARLKLASMDVRIDDLTPEQETYLSSWTHGT
jgi:S-adenosylhomocysteine hydrolase